MKGDAIRMVTQADLDDIDKDIAALAEVLLEVAKWQDEMADAIRAVAAGEPGRAVALLDMVERES